MAERFELLELDIVPIRAADIVEVNPSAPLTLEPDFELIEVEDQIIADAGIGKASDRELYGPAGATFHALDVSGVREAQKHRNALPFFYEAAADFRELINGEEREHNNAARYCDTAVNLDGRFQFPGKAPAGTIDAFTPAPRSAVLGIESTRQMLSHLKPVRNEMLTKGIHPSNYNGGKGLRTAKDPNAKINPLTRLTLDGRDREVYGMVTDGKNGYSQFDGADVAGTLAARLPSYTRGEITYDRETTRTQLKGLIGKEFTMKEASSNGITLNQAFEAGFFWATNDNGWGAHRPACFVNRLLCGNGLIIYLSSDSFTKIIHKGNKTQQRIHEAVDAIINFTSKLGDLWFEASTKNITDPHDGTSLSAHEIYKRLVAKNLVHIDGVSAPDMLDMLMVGYHKEPHLSLMGIVNGITDTAKGNKADPWKVWGAREILEAQAGELIVQQVYNLAPLTREETALF